MWQLVAEATSAFGGRVTVRAGTTTIGRAEDNDVVLGDASASRYHARLELRGAELTVEDCGSRNGTQVNGKAITQRLPLQPGDVIAIGEHTMRVRLPARVEHAFAAEIDLRAGDVVRSPSPPFPNEPVTVFLPAGESATLDRLEALGPANMDSADVSPAEQALLLLSETSEGVQGVESLQQLLDEAGAFALEHLGASRVVLLVRHRSGVMIPAWVSDSSDGAPAILSDALISSSALERRALSVRGDSGAEVICAPILERGEPLGALYASREESSREPRAVLDVANALSFIVGSALARTAGARSAQEHSHFADALAKHHGPDLARRGTPRGLERRSVTALVADLSGFTQAVEEREPEKVGRVLEAFYDRAVRAVVKHDGVVDKFVGDALVAFFMEESGGPAPEIRALRCALELRAEWTRWSKGQLEEEQTPLKVGLASGEALVGVVGSRLRQDFTALGMPMNLATWISAMASPEQILASEETVASAQTFFDVAPLKPRLISRLKQRKVLFEVLAEDRSRATITGEQPTSVRVGRPGRARAR